MQACKDPQTQTQLIFYGNCDKSDGKRARPLHCSLHSSVSVTSFAA